MRFAPLLRARTGRKEDDEASASVALPCQALPRCGLRENPRSCGSFGMILWQFRRGVSARLLQSWGFYLR